MPKVKRPRFRYDARRLGDVNVRDRVAILVECHGFEAVLEALADVAHGAYERESDYVEREIARACFERTDDALGCIRTVVDIARKA